MKPQTIKTVCQNRKAHHDFFIGKTVEAGMVLLGSEVKALREGKGQLADAFADFQNGKFVLLNCNIQPYSHCTFNPHQPDRPKLLLVHKNEARKLSRELSLKRVTLVPIRIYFKGPFAKVELALAQGKKKYDKRESLKKKEADREMRRSVRTR